MHKVLNLQAVGIKVEFIKKNKTGQHMQTAQRHPIRWRCQFFQNHEPRMRVETSTKNTQYRFPELILKGL